MKRIFSILISVLMLSLLAACGGQGKIRGELAASSDFETGFLRTAGADDYGRSFKEAAAYNENLVGIFYFLWLSQGSTDTNVDSFIENGKAENTLTGDDVGYAPTFTYWGEPMYGYYTVEDKWVVRKHVELFINAGLDFICFDCTNNDYYLVAAQTVLDVLLEYSQLGYKVPKAMFMTNSDSTLMTENIYSAFYRRNTYDPIWFCGKGDKPWIIANYGGSDQSVSDRFYFKAAQWPNSTYNQNKFPWISWHYPQETYEDGTNDYTIQSVSVSQHVGIGGGYSDVKVSGVNFSLSGLFAPYNYGSLSDELKSLVPEEKANEYYNTNWGRGYSHATGKNSYDDAFKNVNFEEQWQSVYKNKSVNLVFVTGWNEWIAQKQSKDPVLGSSYGYFVDTYSMEFSRDVEMMNGGYADNCYLQLVSNVRKYKGSGFAENTYHAAVKDGTDLTDLSKWKDAAVYKDLVYETEHRDAPGVGNHYYTNETGRNDIAEVRVASDGDSVYFLITTVDDITAKEAQDTRWMNLFIGVEGQEGGWNGLQYAINRTLDGTSASVDKIADGKFVSAGACTSVVSGKHMLVKIAKSTLGISGGEFRLQFKVCDNLQKDFDNAELYVNGDCAPVGRINYSYCAK